MGEDPEAGHCRIDRPGPLLRGYQGCLASSGSVEPRQTADAATKLFQAGSLPHSSALRILGYSDEAIDQVRKDMAADGQAKTAGDPYANLAAKYAQQMKDGNA